ncbi:MAG: S8 family serine peptidase [Lachnospiraceae bacterium]|nr:S8 family serine peptidase [Lachnospiraceae bacterium]
MNDQKIENQLNLALEATEEEREKSVVLNTGYDREERTWELIVKYTGDLERIASAGIQVTRLLNEYAILVVPESLIGWLAAIPEIEYIEKPKRLYFARTAGKRASCMTPVQRPPLGLTGRGVLVAMLDSGADYRHPEFQNPDGTTRIRALWDQTLEGTPPPGYHVGREYTQEQLNEALAQPEGLPVSRDASGHGTGVLAIAAGNNGVAFESEIIVVKLGTPKADSFPRTTELMMGINYVIEKALEYRMPVAVNISFGNTYGSHTGTSLLETYMDDISNLWKSVFCVGSGNEGASAGHAGGRLTTGEIQNVEFAVGNYEPTLSLQIWKNYVDTFDIFLVHPNGTVLGPFYERPATQRYRAGRTELLVYYGEPSPYSVEQEIYVDFLPVQDYIDSGVWNVRLVPGKIVDGSYQMWFPSSAATGGATRFLRPRESDTLTIPSTASNVITVGAYNAATDAYADFSGRGADGDGPLKPSLVAPGVNIETAAPDGRYISQTGTSFATPFVTGAAALLMQYGVVNGEDPFLYGEKVKAYLQRGARALPGFFEYPNNRVGESVIIVPS